MNAIGALVGIALFACIVYIVVFTFAGMPAFLGVALAKRFTKKGTP